VIQQLRLQDSMPQFVVKAVDERGHLLQQFEQGSTEAEVRERLQQQGYHIFSIRAPGLTQRSRVSRIGANEFLIFNQQFVTLVRAGLPILRALELLETRAGSPRIRALVGAVRGRVTAGELLSQAFKAQEGIPEIYTTTVMAGERSGNLDEVLTRYIQYQRLALSVRRKLLSSLVYPAVLCVLVVVVLTFLVTYVVPQFGTLYKSLNATLPPLTVFMLSLGETIRSYALVGVPLLILIGFAATHLMRTSDFGGRFDGLLLRVPVAGEIWWKYQVALLARTLATLLVGGIPVVTALETAGSALQSKLLRRGLREAAREVREGRGLAQSLGNHRVAPELAVEMIEVGESTGALPQMLNSVADFYDEDISTAMATMMSLVEPAILIVVGTIVAFVLIALYLPIFSLGERIQAAH